MPSELGLVLSVSYVLNEFKMNVHIDPSQCLVNLTQQCSDGGRTEYLEQQRRLMRTEPEAPTGDCAVVALVHAAFRPPAGQSYGEAKDQLLMAIQPWMHKQRKRGEKLLDFMFRRFKQLLQQPRPNPIHGTPSHATGFCLEWFWGYEHIFPNDARRWFCICDVVCSYVLDVQMPGDHTITVHQRVAYTTCRFDPHNTEVANVYRLNPKRTMEYKARGQYEDAVRLWDRQWLDGGDVQLPDWDSRPKLEDFLRD